MRRPIIVCFLSLFWLALAPAHAAERGALFRITAGGHTMHLFGTIHVGVPQFYPLEPVITEALGGASTLALEVDPDQPTAAIVQSLSTHGLLPEGDAGYAALAPAKRDVLERLMRKGGLDPAAARAFKPALLATMLSLSEYEKLGYRADLAADRFLARLARSGKARVLELESLDEQLSLLDRLGRDGQWRFLDEVVGVIESGAQQNEARVVVDAWGNADRAGLDALAARIAADTSLSGSFSREVLLDGRNVALADKLAQLLAGEQKTVAAIGVLHLLGKNSVPALLRARGIEVERVY
jgi:uncharacterized protein YbaP (TraB family)